MISSEVQRTLVKSPPELWAELSDPVSLARHLGELGEIRITRTEPEKLVEWEAEGTTGRVAIKASGWGTKVTLSVNRELPTPALEGPGEVDELIDGPPPETAPEGSGERGEAIPAAESEGQADEAPRATPAIAELDVWASQEAAQNDPPILTAAERFAHDDPEPLLGTRLGCTDDAATLEQTAEPEQDTHEPAAPAADSSGETSEAPPRRGFLARLFGRRRKRSDSPEIATAPLQAPGTQPVPEPAGQEQEIHEPDPAAIEEPAQTPPAPEPSSAETVEEPDPEPVGQDAPATDQERFEQPAPDLAAELEQAEEAASEEVAAVLTGVLDRLGAAHHRPFSRS